MSKTANKFAPEGSGTGGADGAGHEADHPSRWAAIVSISEKIGCVPQTLFEWVKKAEVVRVFAENFGVYGVRKVWRQMNREGFAVARCTIERLMRDLGLQGVIRGKPVRTTISNKEAPCPLDHVNRQFHAPAPNMLWVSDFTYVAT